MIWASKSDGSITYVGLEWHTFTGQPTAEAMGAGWLDMLHPEDRENVADFFAKACASAQAFTIEYRLKHVDGAYLSVVAAAAPSISPVDGVFIGYLGVVSEAGSSPGPGNVIGKLEIRPAAPASATAPLTHIDIIADYLLLAKATAVNAGEKRLLASIDFAISEVMRRLGHHFDETKLH